MSAWQSLVNASVGSDEKEEEYLQEEKGDDAESIASDDPTFMIDPRSLGADQLDEEDNELTNIHNNRMEGLMMEGEPSYIQAEYGLNTIPPSLAMREQEWDESFVERNVYRDSPTGEGLTRLWDPEGEDSLGYEAPQRDPESWYRNNLNTLLSRHPPPQTWTDERGFAPEPTWQSIERGGWRSESQLPPDEIRDEIIRRRHEIARQQALEMMARERRQERNQRLLQDQRLNERQQREMAESERILGRIEQPRELTDAQVQSAIDWASERQRQQQRREAVRRNRRRIDRDDETDKRKYGDE